MTRLTLSTVFLLLAALLARPALADPCGMVPPIWLGEGTPIERIGLQQTYVYYKDGVESFVIRPGFRGRVDDFGMLIPFPAPPAIRKVSDEIFEHLAAAVDPPEVVIDLRYRELAVRGAVADSAVPTAGGLALRRDEVVVLSEEAVGMYQVAVLEAGSAAALSKWMNNNGYRYPEGMDAVCEDYVADGWCFVAVKTQVGSKSAVNPRPGMREADATKPADASFDGHVQAMGFRFPTDELVVPMRLSTYNEGELRNVVYVLTDGPAKIRDIDEKHVVRQIDGRTLYDNLTKPLPVRVIGGEAKDIPEWHRRNLAARRDPAPHNGLARALFASDLLATSTGELVLSFEKTEKELLKIGEALGLRGPDVDRLHHDALELERESMLARALAPIRDMTLTVIDDDMPRDVLARDNLHFDAYTMPAARNTPAAYNARHHGPAPAQQGSIVPIARRDTPSGSAWAASLPVATLTVLVAFGLAAAAIRRRTAAAALLATATAIGALSAPVRADDTRDLETLIETARNGTELAERGWAIVALADHEAAEARAVLVELSTEDTSALVRTWALAARARHSNMGELAQVGQWIGAHPALKRPIEKRLRALIAQDTISLEDLIVLGGRSPALLQVIAAHVMKATEADDLLAVMLTAKEDQTRQTAAALLATMAQQRPDAGVAETAIAGLRFEPDLKAPPWGDGALFVPSCQYEKSDAKTLATTLLKWHVWADQRGMKQLRTVIHNNLRSINLARPAGYPPTWQELTTLQWLIVWRNAFGLQEVLAILHEQDVASDPRYANVFK